jgi:hypothetical protein
MHAPEQDRQRILTLRHHHPVNMIGHQAIGQRPNAGIFQIFADQS